jgi:F-type H+-transporting ATPase subunit c
VIRILGVAIVMLVLFGVANSMGNLFSTWISSIARNPEAGGQIRFAGLMGMALTESLALFALLVALLILYK